MTVSLFDASGKEIKREILDQTQTLLSVKDVNEGIYFLTITSAQGKIIKREKLVISH